MGKLGSMKSCAFRLREASLWPNQHSPRPGSCRLQYLLCPRLPCNTLIAKHQLALCGPCIKER